MARFAANAGRVDHFYVSPEGFELFYVKKARHVRKGTISRILF